MKKYYLFHERGKWLILDSEDKRLSHTNSFNASIANNIEVWYSSIWNIALGPFTNLVEPKYHKINIKIKEIEEPIKRAQKLYHEQAIFSEDDIKSLQCQKDKLVNLKEKMLKKYPHYFI